MIKRALLVSEAEEQKEIVSWFRSTWPEHVQALRVSQFGNHRGRSRKDAAIRTAKAVGQGAVAGESDIAICLPRNGCGSLMIEHKAADGTHSVSTEQEAYIEYHKKHGNCACVTKGVEAAKAAIETYMRG